MSSNEVKLTRVGEGSYDIPLNYGQMKDLEIRNWWETDYNNTMHIAAGVLNCLTSSFEWELDQLKKGARYSTLDSSISWKRGKDESGRNIIKSMTIYINLKVPDELRVEHDKVVEEHTNHGCMWTRSLKHGIDIKLNIIEK